MQPRKPHRRILPQPCRHRPHEAPRNIRRHAEEAQFEAAVLEPHHVSGYAVVDGGGAGGEGGWVRGGEEEGAGVEDGELGGGGDDGDEGELGGCWGQLVNFWR